MKKLSSFILLLIFSLTSFHSFAASVKTRYNPYTRKRDYIRNYSEMDSSLLPDTDNAYDLGSLSLRWKDIHFAGTISGPTAIFTDLTAYENFTLDNINIQSTTSGSPGCSLIGIPAIGTPTYATICGKSNLFSSAGRASGGNVTDAGSEVVNISLGSGFIKATDDDTAEVLSFDWSADTETTTTDARRYVGIIYNSGNPISDIRADETSYDLDTEWPLASVVNEGGELHILNNPWWVTDGLTNVIERFRADGYIKRDENIGGLILSVPGTRNIAVTTGTLWSNMNEFSIPAIDTSVSGTVETYWVNSSGVWTETDASQYPVTQWNDTDLDALQNMSNNWYANWWVYAEADDLEIALIYPQAQYANAAVAEAESPPTNIPDHIAAHGILIGRILFKQGVDAPLQVDTAWETVFTPSQATDHINLANLAWTSSSHTGTASTFAGFDGTGAASEYTEANYLLTDASRAVAGDLIPDGDNTRDLGSTAASWKDIYSDGTVSGVTADFQDIANSVGNALQISDDIIVQDTVSGITADLTEAYNSRGEPLKLGLPGDITLGDETERNMYPVNDLKINLGTASNRINNAYIGSGLEIPSGDTPSLNTVGSLFYDTDEGGYKGSLMFYTVSGWTAIIDFN